MDAGILLNFVLDNHETRAEEGILRVSWYDRQSFEWPKGKLKAKLSSGKSDLERGGGHGGTGREGALAIGALFD